MPKILLADDDELHTSLSSLLRAEGYDVLVVTTGTQLLDELNDTFDLVITDHQMSNMSGLDALRHIRAEKKYESMPIIVLSATTRIRIEVEDLLGGIFLEKGPTHPNTLLEIIEQVLQPR